MRRLGGARSGWSGCRPNLLCRPCRSDAGRGRPQRSTCRRERRPVRQRPRAAESAVSRGLASREFQAWSGLAGFFRRHRAWRLGAGAIRCTRNRESKAGSAPAAPRAADAARLSPRRGPVDARPCRTAPTVKVGDRASPLDSGSPTRSLRGNLSGQLLANDAMPHSWLTPWAPLCRSRCYGPSRPLQSGLRSAGRRLGVRRWRSRRPDASRALPRSSAERAGRRPPAMPVAAAGVPFHSLVRSAARAGASAAFPASLQPTPAENRWPWRGLLCRRAIAQGFETVLAMAAATDRVAPHGKGRRRRNKLAHTGSAIDESLAPACDGHAIIPVGSGMRPIEPL